MDTKSVCDTSIDGYSDDQPIGQVLSTLQRLHLEHRARGSRLFYADTLIGQSPGALLKIKRTFSVTKSGIVTTLQPGDIVRISQHAACARLLDGFHVRGGDTFTMPWTYFLPFGTREICSCVDHRCRCVYEDFEKSLAYHRALAENKAAALKPDLFSSTTVDDETVDNVDHAEEGDFVSLFD